MVETNWLWTDKQQLIVDHLNPREGVRHARHTWGTHLNPRQDVCHARHSMAYRTNLCWVPSNFERLYHVTGLLEWEVHILTRLFLRFYFKINKDVQQRSNISYDYVKMYRLVAGSVKCKHKILFSNLTSRLINNLTSRLINNLPCALANCLTFG